MFLHPDSFPLEIEGDLFESKHALAHCVSADLAMSKGIAVEFRDRFGGVRELRDQKPRVGDVLVLQDKEGQRPIYYLVTKQNYWDKPTYDTLSSCLIQLRLLCIKAGTKTIAMPRIGCGLDRLQWEAVRGSIRRVFRPTDNIAVVVYHQR